MTTRKQEEKGRVWQLYSLVLILGFWMVYLNWEATIHFWLDESKTSYLVCLRVFICFLGLILVLFSLLKLGQIIQFRVQQNPKIEAISWKHFEMVKESIEDIDENLKIKLPDEIAVDRSKTQALTRLSKDFIKTSQVVPVLSEDDVARIKNMSIHFSIKK